MKTVHWCIDYYLAEHVRPSTADPVRREYACKALKRALGRRHAEALLPLDIRRYSRKRAGQGCAAGTIRYELATLQAALNFCAGDRKIAAAPQLPLPAKPDARDRWLTRDETDRLLDECGPRARLFVQIALNTGGRPDAIDALQWTQVDLDRRLIDFNRPGRQQTAKRRPVVPINDTLYTVLTDAQAQAKTKWVLGSPASTLKVFNTAKRRAGLTDITRKTLRHTWACHAAQRGVSLWQIAGVLGDSMATVEKNYLHHHPDHLREAVNL